MNFDTKVIWMADAVYLAAATLVSFVVMWYDKAVARRNAQRKAQGKRTIRRVPERTLFLLAGLGGSVGVLGGMYLLRHKTKHPAFVWGVPAILAVQLVLAWLVLARPFWK